MKKLFTITPETNGRGEVIFAWQPSGNFLATAGANRRIHIFDRQGKIYHQITLQGSGDILQLDWDKEGEVLAILQAGTSVVPIWHVHTKKQDNLETFVKDLTFIKWAKAGPQLAVGSAKGTLLIYNRKTTKLIPVKGKHSKKITCGCWSENGMLALGGEDNQISISNIQGDTTDSKPHKDEPYTMAFSTMKQNSNYKDTTLSVLVGGKTLWLYDTKSQELPIELTFQPQYGRIKSFLWFGDGYILIGFQSGNVVIISTHADEIGSEVNSSKFHEQLYNVAYSPVLKKGATIGDSCVKLFPMSDMASFDDKNSEKIELDDEFNSLRQLEWTADGQILTVSSTKGFIYSFLTSLPVMHETHGSKLIYLTSLRELCVKDVVADTVVATLTIDIEPDFVALGPNHVAVGMNNRVWFYRLVGEKAELIEDKEYLATVDYVRLCETYAAVFAGGKVVLHLLDKQPGIPEERIEKYFPEKEDGSTVTCVSLSTHFLMYSTSRGNVLYFSLEDWTFVNDYRFEVGIISIFPNVLGTRLVAIDETHAAYLYSPVDDHVIPIEKFAGSADRIIWDITDNNIFVACDSKNFTTYFFSHNTLNGPKVEAVRQTTSELVCKTDRPENVVPIILAGGKVISQTKSGSLQTIGLQSHDSILQQRTSPESQLKCFYQYLNLGKMQEAWNIAIPLKNSQLLQELAEKALHYLDIEIAIRTYQNLGDAAMVMALEQIEDVDEVALLVGTIHMLKKNFAEAEAKFMASSQKIKALEMRRDLMHWDRALQLAEALDANQVPYIAREYAQQLELKGEFSKAYEMYNKSIQGSSDPKHITLCTEGIARVTIRTGDLKKGLSIAMNSNSKKLCRECAMVFEELKQFNDAAVLYVKAELFEKAAEIYINSKNYTAAAPLMPKVKSPKLHIQFAKAQEGEGKYKQAVAAYEAGGDMLSVVRLYLTKLNAPAQAIDIVKNNKLTDGAILIAKFCQEKGNFKGAIEFFILANKNQQAFEIARVNDEIETYAAVIGDKGKKEEYLNIARYYESKGDYARAADYYATCEEYEKSLRLYIQSGEKYIDKAIDIVGLSKSDSLTNQLVEYLMGDLDGALKDPKHIFRLYMALGNFTEAAKTALSIAKQEQELGNFTTAHKILLDTHRELMQRGVHIPSELRRNLMLLHSYGILKLVLALDPVINARILIRVAKNMSKFPTHQHVILHATAVRCFQAGLKRSAFEYASILCRPEYKSKLSEAHMKPVQQIVRKRREETQPDEDLTPCPYCNFKVPITELDCPSCKNHIPYCIVTGCHMVHDDWSMCPSCEFPALYSMFSKALATNNSVCPMCNKKIGEVQHIQNPTIYLKKWQAVESASTPVTSTAQ